MTNSFAKLCLVLLGFGVASMSLSFLNVSVNVIIARKNTISFIRKRLIIIMRYKYKTIYKILYLLHILYIHTHTHTHTHIYIYIYI